MPTKCSADAMDFGRASGRCVVAAFDGELVTADAGALLLASTDRALQLVERIAACFQYGRDSDLIAHAIAAMVAQRAFGLASLPPAPSRPCWPLATPPCGSGGHWLAAGCLSTIKPSQHGTIKPSQHRTTQAHRTRRAYPRRRCVLGPPPRLTQPSSRMRAATHFPS